MPAGVTLGGVLAVLIPICIVTIALRQLPFSFIKALKRSELIGVLGLMMPVGVMVVLVIYTVFGQLEAPGGLIASLLGVAVTLGLHIAFKRAGLSIVGGTAAYMILVNLVF